MTERDQYTTDIVVTIPGVECEPMDDTEAAFEQVVAQALSDYDIEYDGTISARRGDRWAELSTGVAGVSATLYDGLDSNHQPVIADEAWFTWDELDTGLTDETIVLDGNIDGD